MNSLSSFDQFDIPMMGHVLDQLNIVTGSRGIVNKADIAVLKRYTSNLACTSKNIAAQVNHPSVTHLFLESLSKKYGQSCEYFAAQFNSIGTRNWLWRYITKEGGDAQVYQVIQDIFEFAANVLTEAENAGLELEYSEGRQEWPSHNPYFYRTTKQGFVLYNNWEPVHIVTPLGEIKLYEGVRFIGESALSVTEVFIKRLNAEYACGECFSEDGVGTDYEIEASYSETIRKISEDEMKKISQEESEARKGTQNLIVNSLCHNYSSYNIKEVNRKKVPEVVWHEKGGSERSYELIKMIWEMLEANRLGLDPIAKPIKVNKLESVEEPICKNIAEVSEWGIALAAKLEQQPIILGAKSLVGQDAYILKTLNSSANQFLDKGSEWPIHTFIPGNNRQYGVILNTGIQLSIDTKRTPCDLNTLKTAYDAAIKSIGQNWTKSELKDHPTIFYKESEEDYVLFVNKDKILYQKYALINNLAYLLGLSKSISCFDKWDDTTSSGAYVWIRKNNLEMTLEALNFSWD